MNDKKPVEKSKREVIEGIESSGEKVFLLVTDLGQKRIAVFFPLMLPREWRSMRLSGSNIRQSRSIGNYPEEDVTRNT